MNIYLIEQDYFNGYDTYDSAVVIAESEEEARKVHPSKYSTHVKNGKWMGTHSGKMEGEEYEYTSFGEWLSYKDIDKIKVTLIGKAISDKRGVILASFNAG